MNEKNKTPGRGLRFASRVWMMLGAICWWLGQTPEAYVAMFMIIAAVFAVGDEIMQEVAHAKNS